MLSQVSSMRERIDGEIAAMKVRELPPAHAHHLMVEAVKANVMPASRLPKVIEAWEEPKHEEFRSRTAWSLFNAFTEVQKPGSPRMQIEGSLRLTALFRRELQRMYPIHEAVHGWTASRPSNNVTRTMPCRLVHAEGTRLSSNAHGYHDLAAVPR